MADDKIVKFPEQPEQAAPPPEVGALGFDDLEAAVNMRAWLQQACETAGAKITGGGFGSGVADLDIELEGCQFMVSIKPFSRS